MNRTISFLAMLAAGTVLAAAASAASLDEIKERGTIVVGVKTDYKPFGFRDPSGEIVGIEPDLAADLAAPDGPISLAEKSLGVLGGIDVLVNNAGISYPESVEALDTGHFDEVMQVNLRAPALLAARIGRAMAESGGGSLVTIASAAALRPLPEHYAYCTSKAGLIMATKVLALELGGRGVRANSICPTVVLTDMGQKVWGDSAKSAPMLARIPAGRFAVPSEVSATALWLASDASSMINGIDVPVDGGYLVS